MALNPCLLIMDEPTTALDVVVQKDILQQIVHLAGLVLTTHTSLLKEQD